jgi:hypothetical protein
LITLAGIYGWAFEPPDDPEAGHHGDHHDGTSPEGEAAGGELTEGDAATAGDAVDKEVETVG